MLDQFIKPSVLWAVALWPGVKGVWFRFVSGYADMLIVPWLFEASVLFTYLLARLTSLMIPLGLTFIGRKLEPQLAVLILKNRRDLFQAAAARVNLGYLMVCGAISLLVLNFAPNLATAITIVDPAFEAILIWSVIAQSGSMLFGATGLLMHVVNRGAFHDLLRGITVMLFGISIVLLGASDPVITAQTLAVAQLTHAAICALLLTQCGVWPGLASLFHKEIKLF